MLIRVQNLCKSYHGVAVLRDVTFTAGAGVTCIMAPSGGGKTTLLRILLGLEHADSGTLEGLDGCRWAAVFQDNRLLEELDAKGNLRFALGADWDRGRAERLLEELALDPADDKPVREFSGGMKRRLALARALLAVSDALALDEPFTGLDRENRNRAVSCVRRYGAGKPILLATHSPADAAVPGTQLLRLP